MNSSATIAPEQAARTRWSATRWRGRRSWRSSGPSAGRSTLTSPSRRTANTMRTANPSARPINTCCAASSSAAGVERHHGHRRQRGLRSDGDEKVPARCARASAPTRCPSTGSDVNSASERKKGHSSGVSQRLQFGFGEWSIVGHAAVACAPRRRSTDWLSRSPGMPCSVRWMYSTSVGEHPRPGHREHRHRGQHLGHERQAWPR